MTFDGTLIINQSQ